MWVWVVAGIFLKTGKGEYSKAQVMANVQLGREYGNHNLCLPGGGWIGSPMGLGVTNQLGVCRSPQGDGQVEWICTQARVGFYITFKVKA